MRRKNHIDEKKNSYNQHTVAHLTRLPNTEDTARSCDDSPHARCRISATALSATLLLLLLLGDVHACIVNLPYVHVLLWL